VSDCASRAMEYDIESPLDAKGDGARPFEG